MFDNPILLSLAKKYRRSVAQIILNFLTKQNIVVIPKSSRRERMEENITIFDFELSSDDVKLIEKINKNQILFDWF